MLLLGFMTLLNISDHQHCFRHRAWKARQILLRGSHFGLRYFTCSKSTTRDPRLYFPSEGSHTQDFYALKNSIDPRQRSNLRTSDPEASMITTGPPGSTHQFEHICIVYNRFCTATQKRKKRLQWLIRPIGCSKLSLCRTIIPALYTYLSYSSQLCPALHYNNVEILIEYITKRNNTNYRIKIAMYDMHISSFRARQHLRSLAPVMNDDGW